MPHNTFASFVQKITEVMASIDRETMKRACRSFLAQD
jgi:hypothetical protein